MTDNRPVRQTLHDMDDRLAETNRQLDQSNTLAAMQLGAQIGQAALQERTNRLMAEADDLLDEANRQRTETNKRLTRMGVTQEKTLEATRGVQKAVADANNTIRESFDRTERLIREQNGRIDGIRDEMRQARIEQAYQSFAQWRQSPEGQQYLAWRNAAEHAINRMNEWTNRMNTARQQDVEDHVRRMVADEAERIDLQYGDEPQEPDLPPITPVREPPFGDYPEPKPEIKMGNIWYLIAFVIGILGGL